MRPTNYHLFDFLDFDLDLKRNESLWKAYKPTKVWEEDGDIKIKVPFQKQLLSNDMAKDETAKKEEYFLTLRAYEPKILRLFIGFSEDKITDESPMLQYSPRIKRVKLNVEFKGDSWIVRDSSSQVRAIINIKEPKLERWSDLLPDPQETLDIRLYPDGKREIRLSAYDHFSPPRYDGLPLAFCKSENKIDRSTISFESKADECFVGTGERFSKMDLSGQTFFLKNQDGQGVNNRRTYKNIPFYISSRMYGAFFHTSAHSKLSLSGVSTRSVEFLSDEAKIDVFLIVGDTCEEIIHSYRDLTGYPGMPPLWSFGIWMSRMSYFSALEVENICSRLRKEDYPCDVIHLDTGWFKTDWLCEWKFNKERFPDPQGFISKLKSSGFRVTLWQLPYIAEDAEQIQEARKNHYIGTLTKRQQTEGSNFSALDYAGTIDFTSPEATLWYKGLLKELLQMGVAAIKADFGENIHMDATYKGMDAKLLNNLYALLYQKAVYEITREVTGDGIIWARAAWAGSQRYPVHWGGDSCSSWDGMAGSLKGGLHFGLSGFAFWSHDVPGFHSLPNFMNSRVNDDVYLRWTQFGVFSSHIRYHGTSPREPWHYPKIKEIVKKWWKLRYKMIPYILKQSEIAIKGGLPLVQALIFHHKDDKLCWHIDDEYYFGNDILVAPVMNSENRRDVYIPEGSFREFFTGKKIEGPRWIKDLEMPLEYMPIYIKDGAQIPIYEEEVSCTDEMDLEKVKTIKIDDTFKGIKL